MLIRSSFLLLCWFVTVFGSGTLRGQTFELSGGGGYGFKDGDDQSRTGVGAVSASLGWPVRSKHKLQFDYMFTDPRNRAFDIHFVTGSYVLQARSGRIRPFFQVGAGAAIEKFDRSVFGIPPGRSTTDTTFGLLFGAGVVVGLGESAFIRPELRSYLFVGPTAVVLPGVSLGWRF